MSQETIEAEFIEGESKEGAVTPSETIGILQRAEIDQQITTARAYPRSIKRFRQEAMTMVTMDEDTAQECIYALPRGGKTIQGPSARFAEILAYSWGNCRAGARVVDVGALFVTSQGVFHDLERNLAITFEVQRRITDKYNKRFSDDMITVTSNAASSIALRNSVLKGIPKAMWVPLYAAARKAAVGDIKTLPNRRAKMLEQFLHYGIEEARILGKVGVESVEDIKVEHLEALIGFFQAIKNEEITPDECFPQESEAKKNLREKLGKKEPPANVNTETGELTDEDIPA